MLARPCWWSVYCIRSVYTNLAHQHGAQAQGFRYMGSADGGGAVRVRNGSRDPQTAVAGTVRETQFVGCFIEQPHACRIGAAVQAQFVSVQFSVQFVCASTRQRLHLLDALANYG